MVESESDALNSEKVGSDTEMEIKEKELYQQSLNSTGWSMGFTRTESGQSEQISGISYRVQGREYIMPDSSVPEKDKGRPYSLEDKGFVADEDIIREVREQAEMDKNIKNARAEKAEAMSGGDPLLAEVIRSNIDYNNGEVGQPMVVNGIDFYQVSRNSSHEFFMGVMDGKRYTYSFAPDEDSDGAGRVREVDDFESGYHGHY